MPRCKFAGSSCRAGRKHSLNHLRGGKIFYIAATPAAAAQRAAGSRCTGPEAILRAATSLFSTGAQRFIQKPACRPAKLLLALRSRCSAVQVLQKRFQLAFFQGGGQSCETQQSEGFKNPSSAGLNTST